MPIQPSVDSNDGWIVFSTAAFISFNWVNYSGVYLWPAITSETRRALVRAHTLCPPGPKRPKFIFISNIFLISETILYLQLTQTNYFGNFPQKELGSAQSLNLQPSGCQSPALTILPQYTHAKTEPHYRGKKVSKQSIETSQNLIIHFSTVVLYAQYVP